MSRHFYRNFAKLLRNSYLASRTKKYYIGAVDDLPFFPSCIQPGTTDIWSEKEYKYMVKL